MSLIRSHVPGLAARLRVSGSTAPSLLSTRRVSCNRENLCRLSVACTPRPGSADHGRARALGGQRPFPVLWEGALRALATG
jgi:hypothetical protein